MPGVVGTDGEVAACGALFDDVVEFRQLLGVDVELWAARVMNIERAVRTERSEDREGVEARGVLLPGGPQVEPGFVPPGLGKTSCRDFEVKMVSFLVVEDFVLLGQLIFACRRIADTPDGLTGNDPVFFFHGYAC